MCLLIFEPCHEKTNNLHLCKTKGTDQLCSYCTFVFATQLVQFLYLLPNFQIQNFQPLAFFCDCTGRFVSDLFGNLNCWFSRDAAHLFLLPGHVDIIFSPVVSELNLAEEDLNRVPYLLCCVLEAIRMHPVGIITRRVVNEFTVKV